MTPQSISKNGVTLTSFNGHVFTVELSTKRGSQVELESTNFNTAHKVFAEWVKIRSQFKF